MAKITDRRPSGRGAGRRDPARGLQGRRRLHLQPLLHRRPAALRRLPHVPGRDRGRARPAALLHDQGRRRHGGPHHDRRGRQQPQGRAVVHPRQPLRPLPHLPPPRALPARRHLPARRRGHAPLPDLPQELPLRAADDLRGRRHVQLRAVGGRGALVLRSRGAPAGRPGQPVPRVRPEDVHHLHPLRARLRRDPPHQRDHAGRQGLQHAHRLRRRRADPRIELRLLRRLHRRLPDGDAAGAPAQVGRPSRRSGPTPSAATAASAARSSSASRDGAASWCGPSAANPVSNDQICVRGRFHYDALRKRDRLSPPAGAARRGDGARRRGTQALDEAAAAASDHRAGTARTPSASSAGRSPRTRRPTCCRSWRALAVGTNNIDFTAGPLAQAHRRRDPRRLRQRGAARPTSRSSREAACVVVVGDDLEASHPVASLRVKDAVVAQRTPSSST